VASPPSLTTLLETIVGAGVELVLVGGLAAAAQGAPIATFDVDVVHRRTPENVARLLAVIATIDARYRGHTDVRRPTHAILSGSGRSLLMTTLGPLDVLGVIEGGRDYDALLPDTVDIPFRGHSVRVLSLATIVVLKRASTRPKDRAALPILEETLRRKGVD
jgi:hypothetical protein